LQKIPDLGELREAVSAVQALSNESNESRSAGSNANGQYEIPICQSDTTPLASRRRVLLHLQNIQLDYVPKLSVKPINLYAMVTVLNAITITRCFVPREDSQPDCDRSPLQQRQSCELIEED
jgi:hypothetical protein